MTAVTVKPFAMIRPVAAVVTASNVPEPNPAYSYPAWSAAGVYVVGDRVERPTTHRTYQCRVAVGPVATLPEADPTHWADIGATSRHLPFDKGYQAQAQNDDSITYTLTVAEYADAIGILNAHCAKARVEVAGTTYDEEVTMYTRVDVDNLHDFFVEPWVFKKDVVFFHLPMRLGNVVNITLTNTGGVAACGEIVTGLSKIIGGTQYGVRTSEIDYSVETVDDFGNTVMSVRPYAKRMNVTLEVKNSFIDEMHRIFYEYRGQPVLWVGAGNLYECLIVWGRRESFENVIPYAKYSTCSLGIKGHT